MKVPRAGDTGESWIQLPRAGRPHSSHMHVRSSNAHRFCNGVLRGSGLFHSVLTKKTLVPGTYVQIEDVDPRG